MTAKEMFEEMGYSVTVSWDSKYNLRYNKKNLKSFSYRGREIDFDLERRVIHMWFLNYQYNASPNLIVAIHQQMKELGWIE